MGTFRKILVPLDGSEISEWVLAKAARLWEHPDSKVTLLAVEERSAAAGEPAVIPLWLETRAREVSKWGASVSVRAVRGEPAETILREVRRGEFDLIAMTTHGRTGLSRLLFGSVTQKVLQLSPVPLLLFRPLQRPDETLSPVESREAAKFRRILVPLDGSKGAEEILPEVMRLAKESGSHLHLFTAVPGGKDERMSHREAELYLERQSELLRDRGWEVTKEVRTGGAAAEALGILGSGFCDAVAMMTHGRTGVPSALYGSVAERLLHDSGVPILVQRNRRLRERGATLVGQSLAGAEGY